MIKTLKNGIVYLTTLAMLYGCAGMGDGLKKRNVTKSTPVSAAHFHMIKKDSELEQTIQNRFKIGNTDSYEKAIEPFVKKFEPRVTRQDIDNIDGADEIDPTHDDFLAENYSDMTIPRDTKFSDNLKKYPTTMHAQNLSKADIGSIISKVRNPSIYSGSYVLVTKDGYTAVPKKVGPFFDMISESGRKQLEDIVKGVPFDKQTEYTLKQKGQNLIDVTIYDVKDDELVRPVFELFHNGYRFFPGLVDKDKYDPENEEKAKNISHELIDKAAGRLLGDAAVTTAAYFIYPPIAIPVGLTSFYTSNQFGKVIVAYEEHKDHVPPYRFSKEDIDSIVNSYNSDVQVVHPFYFNNELKALVIGKLRTPDYNVVIEEEGYKIAEDNKLVTGFLIDAASLGIAAGIYKAGRHSVDKETEYIFQKVSDITGHHHGGRPFAR